MIDETVHLHRPTGQPGAGLLVAGVRARTRLRGAAFIVFGLAVIVVCFVGLAVGWPWIFAAWLVVPGLLFIREGSVAVRLRAGIALAGDSDSAPDNTPDSAPANAPGDTPRHVTVWNGPARPAAHAPAHTLRRVEVMHPVAAGPELGIYTPCHLVALTFADGGGVAVEYARSEARAREVAALLSDALALPEAPHWREWSTSRAEALLGPAGMAPRWVPVTAISITAGVSSLYLAQAAVTGHLLLAPELGPVARTACATGALALPVVTWWLRRLLARETVPAPGP